MHFIKAAVFFCDQPVLIRNTAIRPKRNRMTNAISAVHIMCYIHAHIPLAFVITVLHIIDIMGYY